MAIGTYALYTNNTGSQNVAIGYRSLDNNTTGGANIANGTESLHLNSTGTGNVAIGLQALYNNTTGILNIAIGHQTGFFATGSYNIYIGNPGIASESNAIRIGTPGTHTATYLSGNVFCQSLNITSDRNAKERFTAVNAREVLDKVSRMPITEWQYKTDSEIRHIGPMAQDFHKAFSVGSDEKHITTVDADGVALAAIQGLNEKLEEQVARKDADMGKLKSENHALAERLNALEKKLGLGRAQTSRAKR